MRQSRDVSAGAFGDDREVVPSPCDSTNQKQVQETRDASGAPERRAARDATGGVRERPILFSGPMVRAILDGTKSQTRRVVTQPTALEWLAAGMFAPAYVADPGNHLSPFGYAGDRLWVRETWCVERSSSELRQAAIAYYAGGSAVCPIPVGFKVPEADERNWETRERRSRPSIHMPRWASRLTLEVTGMRVERVQDISEADAVAEGVATYAEAYMAKGNPRELTPVEQYEYLWNSLNEPRGYGWDANPWVWVLTFRRHEGRPEARELAVDRSRSTPNQSPEAL